VKTDTVIKQQLPVVKAADYLGETRGVMARLDADLIDRISEQIWQAYEQERTVYLFGNGGSAALASHLACDLAKGTAANGRRRMRAVSLNDNLALLTALANDLEYDEIFAEQLHHIEPGDVALAISSSGNSPNVVRGLEVAQQAGATTVAITGFKGGRVKSLCDMCLVVPSDNVQYIEDSHLSVMHAIFSAVRQRMLNSADRE
jgi:D-sedoheptulose 7-phosphate isomerase